MISKILKYTGIGVLTILVLLLIAYVFIYIHTENRISITTGTTPEGKVLENQYMPWQSIRHFTDDELTAIYLYLQSLPTEQ